MNPSGSTRRAGRGSPPTTPGSIFRRQQLLHQNGPDDYLTPLDLIRLLGPFDLDPCCYPFMPWRTARRMYSLSPWEWVRVNTRRDKKTGKLIVPPTPKAFQTTKVTCTFGDGLAVRWRGVVFMNHPYSDGMPWVEKFVAHGCGVSLTSAKSTDTRWGQLLLSTCTSAYFLKGRIPFYRPDGTQTDAALLSNVLWAYGAEQKAKLERLASNGYPGVHMKRVR